MHAQTYDHDQDNPGDDQLWPAPLPLSLTRRRTIQVLPAPPDLPFPHVNQVWLIERYVTDAAGAHVKRGRAAPCGLPHARAGNPGQIAACTQGQWAIESWHWLRDTCYREDRSRVHTRSGPRNLAINALRLAGRSDITEASRWASRNVTRPCTILGRTS